ncbi:DNA cytosine methyltransferase [Limnothrix sp. PR1529]|uniref:DNA cytosine methyltransferase n=1 Tax=Limnothrix sp. PR1529 TaxID=1704291 RepID=UPI000C1612C6|nr:DNA cytosine methyltransferase [Limnothrix sp. PR1529]
MTVSRRPIAVDLFAGAGGMSLGFEMAGFDVAVAVEIDPIHCLTHQYNFPQGAVLCRSAAEVTGAEIRQQLAAVLRGDRPSDSERIRDSALTSRLGLEEPELEIDVLFGGPPCQGFSMMGKRAFDDPRNALMFHFARLVNELRPKYFVIENVRGMTLGKHRAFLSELIELFADFGYQVEANYQVLNAAHYGVPQDRQRLFLLGARSGWPLPSYPAPQTRRPPVCKSAKRDRTLAHLPICPTVAGAIGDLPDVDQYPELRSSDWLDLGQLADPPGDYARWLRGALRDPADFSHPRRSPRSGLSGCLRTDHSAASVARFQTTLPGEVDRISRFLKLHPEGICNTLRAGTPSNRGAFTSPRPIHPIQGRCITVREAARLHSYPDWFCFHGTKWHGMRQIGNSVPPLLARAVAAQVRSCLPGEPTLPDRPIPIGDPQWLSYTMSQAADFYAVSRHAIAPRRRQRDQAPAEALS